MTADCKFANNCIPYESLRGRRSRRPAKKLRQLIEKIRITHTTGPRKRRDYLIRLYLNSTEAKLLAARRANGRLKPCNRLADKKLQDIASRLNPWAGTSEPVELRLKLKPNGDFRPIIDFGFEQRTLQHLVLPVLRATSTICASQFACNGGLHTAVVAVADAMAKGFRWGIHIDIENCFPSFDGDAIKELLALPKEVTERVILSRHFNVTSSCLEDLLGTADDGFHEPWFALVRLGIAQGSAASNWVCEVVVSHVLKRLPSMDGVLIINYADNILILAKSESDAVSMAQALGDALRVSPAGPLKPKLEQRFSPADKCSFLGHSIWVEEGTVNIDVSKRTLDNFEAKMRRFERLVRKSAGPIVRKRALRLALRYITSWAGTHKLCASTTALRAGWSKRVSDVATKLGV